MPQSRRTDFIEFSLISVHVKVDYSMAENILSAEEREIIRREEHENALVTQARHRLPFVVPWANEAIVPGKGFQSGNMLGDPWVANSPFIPLEQHQRCMIYQPNGDAHAHYCSAESQSHESSTEHYSASIGATVDVKFASANVTGSYDKTVQENRDVGTVLIVASIRFFVN